MIKQFNDDCKIMKHKLKCIGGSEESHSLITTKGRVEVDVIPNTYIYAKVLVKDQLLQGAKLTIEYDEGTYCSNQRRRRNSRSKRHELE